LAICPYCGKRVELVGRDMMTITPHPPFVESMRQLDTTAPFDWTDADTDEVIMEPGWTEYERRQAGRAPTVEGDVGVPLSQSVIGGIMSGLLAVPPTVMFDLPWQVPLLVSTVVSAVFWFVFLGEHRNMLWRVERILKTDIDGDGQRGKPVEHRTVIEGRIDDGRNIQDLVLYFDDVPPEKVDLLFQAALGGQSLCEPAWCGKSKPFSRPQFVGVRDRMIDAGLWAWINPESHAQGVQVLANGRVLMSRWRAQFARTHAHSLDVV